MASRVISAQLRSSLQRHGSDTFISPTSISPSICSCIYSSGLSLPCILLPLSSTIPSQPASSMLRHKKQPTPQELYWARKQREEEERDANLPPGLINHGNTCFMNSTLQGVRLSDSLARSDLMNLALLVDCDSVASFARQFRRATCRVPVTGTLSVTAVDQWSWRCWSARARVGEGHAARRRLCGDYAEGLGNPAEPSPRKHESEVCQSLPS